MKNIFLCGFMGCGKSTVGKELSALIGADFIDMDKYIEQKAGRTVSEIFGQSGEKKFREYETAAAKEISARSGIVAALGGGAVLSAENTAVFKSGGLIVLIDVPLEIIIGRLNGDTTRPLLQSTDKLKIMRTLYEKRMPVYKTAAAVIVSNSDDSPPDVIARKIASNTKVREMLSA